MSDPRIGRLAHLLVSYCVQVQPGDKVILHSSSLALPLVAETYREILRAGGHPFVEWQEEIFQEILLKEGNHEQLGHIAPPERLLIDTYDCRIAIRAARNTRSLNGIDLARQRLHREGQQELLATRMRRAAAGEMRWVGLIYPTEAFAQEADMSLTEYQDFVYGACFVDRADPAAEWRRIHGEQQRLVDYLSGKSRVVVRGPNADLRLSIAGRTFINSDGRRNMPSGEIFTGPVEDSVEGWIRFTYPAIVGGREVEGIELTFEGGRVVRATAAKNQEFLLDMLDTDPGARYLGEFAVGTNHGIARFTKSILFDEKIGGTIHVALGRGYPETGSQNVSAIHWDMICDMREDGEIWVDDELFYRSGEFQI